MKARQVIVVVLFLGGLAAVLWWSVKSAREGSEEVVAPSDEAVAADTLEARADSIAVGDTLGVIH